MASIKKEIFLASRFEEFKDIRTELANKIKNYPFMEAIDLNNNQASHKSPLEESLFHVRKSEIMILLVGETYGTVPEGESKSYTHLEYTEALKESSNTRILVFCIGNAYSGSHIEYAKTDKNMKQWQIELEKNHRLSKFGDKNNVDEITEKIMIMLLSSVYDLNPEENLVITQDEELYLETVEDEENFLYDDEAEFLDNKLSEQQAIGITDVDEEVEGFELLKIPGKLAALEQKKEAQIAIEIQDYYTARVHLKKALEFRPLDFETNYWLAKLYVASAKKNLFFEIEEYLLRAARIALQDKNRFKASHCYQLIIQATIFSDKENEGLKYIGLAEEITPNFARLYYEKAKFMLNFGHDDEAKKALIQAMNIRMDILADISKDPFFLQYKDIINTVKVEMKQHLKKSCYAIASQSNEMKNLFHIESQPIALDKLSIHSLWKYARNNFISQYKLLASNIHDVKDDQISLLTDKIELIDEMISSSNKIDKVFHIQHIDQQLHEIFTSYKEKVSAINASSRGIILLFILSIIFVGVMITNLVSISSVWIPSLLAMISGIVWVFLKTKKTKAKIKYIDKLEEIIGQKKEQINSLNKMYKNIVKAFKLFELTTVSKSSSKLVPFKSLNNASYGSVVRVTPYSYKKYTEKGNKIEILEDFPECLEIKDVDIDNYSFLAKVVDKKYDSLTLSRFGAYYG